MTTKLISESPKITDTIKFELTTTDVDGNLINPYQIDKVVIYFIIREFTAGKNQEYTEDITDEIALTSYFSRSHVVKTFGNEDDAAWLSIDVDNSLLEKVDVGEFELLWKPEFAREGDYVICWTWTPIIAGDKLATSLRFYLQGDTQATTSIPTHFTDADKYSTLLERYLPEYCKLRLSDKDLTPDVLNRFNLAVADGFTTIENLANQTIDLLDANAVHEQLLLYLANLFNLKLKSNDTALWRRQIKAAIPTFKQKGTLAGLKQALLQAGITFDSWSQLWQTVSPYTWQEAFTVTDDQTEFELAKTVYDASDFDLYLRVSGASTYTSLTAADYATISFDSENYVYILEWIGDTALTPIILEDGDIVRIVYKLRPILDAGLETYIRSLPLADDRDETEVEYPPKNWNVYLIEDTDSMFDTICPTRHPFRNPLVYGKVRTEFPYSENIYNMEEYNASLRNSTNPCDLAKDFMDDCGCCLSSKFNINLTIEELSTNRITEAEDIIDEFKPFHAQVHQLNVGGKVNEIMFPQQESWEILVKMDVSDTIVYGNDAFTRVIEDGLVDPIAIKRNVLATVDSTTAASGSASNLSITLYSPGINFEPTILGLDESNNLLEILSGVDTGEYTVTNGATYSVDIVQGTPDTINEPISASSFPFRLSNVLFDGTIDSVTQADIFSFSDDNVDFVLSGIQAGWMITVTSPGPLVGTYTVDKVFPNDSFTLTSWASTSSSTNISYQLKDDVGDDVGDASTTGEMTVTRRALVDGGTDFRLQFGVKQGDYLQTSLSSTQYLILEFVDDDNFYILNWTGGDIGSVSAKAFRRLIDNAVGYLDVRGMTIDTSPTDYEATLAISNGANELGPLLENDQFKENFLILYNSKYYKIVEIDGTEITINGPKQTWGLSGTPINFDIIQFAKEPQTVQGHNFLFIDRRNGDIIEIETETGMSMSFMGSMLNLANSDNPIELQSQNENIFIEVEWLDD